MGHITWRYRRDPRTGRIVNCRCDSDDLKNPDLIREGWRDSPDKVEGAAQAKAATEAHAAVTAATVGQREAGPTPAALAPVLPPKAPQRVPTGRPRGWRKGQAEA